MLSIDKILGKLNKWKWLLPSMLYKGRVSIASDFVAYLQFYCLACMDPSSGWLTQIQAKINTAK